MDDDKTVYGGSRKSCSVLTHVVKGQAGASSLSHKSDL